MIFFCFPVPDSLFLKWIQIRINYKDSLIDFMDPLIVFMETLVDGDP